MSGSLRKGCFVFNDRRRKILLLFFVGGVTYAEIMLLMELIDSQHEIIVGATKIIQHNEYAKQLVS